ncbi:hypothetical protein Taro_007073, partial [Colocasia esculenta]|nr:hypothetical protein [Colocasia esculenta]
MGPAITLSPRAGCHTQQKTGFELPTSKSKAQGESTDFTKRCTGASGRSLDSRNPSFPLPMPSSIFFFFLLLLFLLLCAFPRPAISKSTIEPCAGSDACAALVGYTLYADLKVSEVTALFQADPAALLAANAFDASLPDAEDRILPAGLFLRVPVTCACADGIRKCVSVRYRARPDDTLASIAGSVYAGLVSADQIREANGITDPEAVEAGRSVAVPLPCFCFNSSDNMLPAVYLSYVVRVGDTVPGIATAYSTTVADIMNVNAMGTPSVKPCDIIAIPLPACASTFPKYSSDYGLVVANGTYTITASHCVQCTCGPEDPNLHCMPASLSVSCSSMQCRNSDLMLGNVTSQLTSAGCSVSSCTYGGFVNGTIITTLSNSLQPKCPGTLDARPSITHSHKRVYVCSAANMAAGPSA